MHQSEVNTTPRRSTSLGAVPALPGRPVAVMGILAMGLLLAAVPVQAQSPHVGFGMAINTGEATPPVFRLPINVTSRLRIEPEVGYERDSYEVRFTDTSNGGSTGVERYENRTSERWIGTAVLLTHTRDQVQLQCGGRFGHIRQEERTTYEGFGEEDTSKSRMSGWYGGPVVGGEYFFTDRFSLGVDLMLRYSSMKETRPDGESGRMTERRTRLHTETALTARIYGW
jgi:hypothetical protein